MHYTFYHAYIAPSSAHAVAIATRHSNTHDLQVIIRKLLHYNTMLQTSSDTIILIYLATLVISKKHRTHVTITIT